MDRDMAHRANPKETASVYWLTRTEADVPQDDAWMAPVEVATLAGLRFPKRSAEWRLGRYTAKQVLLACLAEQDIRPVKPASIAVCAADDGAPEVFLRGRPAPFTLSISHREGVAFCAVASGVVELGCDLEKIEPRSTAFVTDYFTPEEQRLVDDAAEGDRPWLANLIWSAKESALKALREGLRLDTRAVVVTVNAPQETVEWRPMAVFFTKQRQRFTGWYRMEGGYVWTVVADPSPEQLVAG